MGRYRFDHWEDGSTNPTRTLTVTADITIIAYYLPIQRTVMFQSTPIATEATINGQNISSGGTIIVDDGSTITITVPTEI